MAVKWKWNLSGFADLRNHPSLVSGMSSAAERAATATPYEVQVVVWPHAGRRSGPRTSVQVWAESFDARKQANENPGDLVAVLNRVKL